MWLMVAPLAQVALRWRPSIARRLVVQRARHWAMLQHTMLVAPTTQSVHAIRSRCEEECGCVMVVVVAHVVGLRVQALKDKLRATVGSAGTASAKPPAGSSSSSSVTAAGDAVSVDEIRARIAKLRK